jgi:hypothetical protein
MLGSRTGREAGSAAATMLPVPSTRVRMAPATWRLEASLARKPSAPASRASEIVSRRVSAESISTLVPGEDALTARRVVARSGPGMWASSSSTVGSCLAASSIAWWLS